MATASSCSGFTRTRSASSTRWPTASRYCASTRRPSARNGTASSCCCAAPSRSPMRAARSALPGSSRRSSATARRSATSRWPRSCCRCWHCLADLYPDHGRQGLGAPGLYDALCLGRRGRRRGPVRCGLQLSAAASAGLRLGADRCPHLDPDLRTSAVIADRLLRARLGRRHHQAHAAGREDPRISDRSVVPDIARRHLALGRRAAAVPLQRPPRRAGARLFRPDRLL